ncbi:hypothetical protein BDY21DRAFT_304478 [Lineolata rhizophorae]|uniref:Guanine nucleotide-exchange factor SEC12 n=1 Tax=Lineolata rhizophorae TaxID=578093 RepID=A0A6A6P0N1_9PEZI|nr:hypothetical protein BDY21DRAFT_304478 [Lineolata rhizophorae]
MTPPVSFTKTTLSYPVYAADFDPYNRGYLVVGGGGGEGRSGVGNKITLLDVTSRATISIAAEIELSSNEDSVMSLANLASKDGLITFAGINSAESAQKAGKNEHFRTFTIQYPERKKASEKAEKAENKPQGHIEFENKCALFKKASTKNDEGAYQRVFRLSPAFRRESGSKRIGAIATGFAKPAEVVIFSATTAAPTAADVILRAELPENAEANDLDIAERSEGSFIVTYAVDCDVYQTNITYDFGTRKPVGQLKEPRMCYSFPYPDVFASAGRPRIRAIRFLTPDYLLLLGNHQNRSGSELFVLRIFDTGPAELVLQKRLPRHVKAGVSLDVCVLDADPVTGARQIVVAVAGQDVSISVYTIEYLGSKRDTLSKFRKFNTMQNVHPLQMTKICFAPFHRPGAVPAPSSQPSKQEPSSSERSPKKKRKGKSKGRSSEPKDTKPATVVTSDPPAASSLPPASGQQFIRLASISMGNTVVVDTFTLVPHSKQNRYILSGSEPTLFSPAVAAVVTSIFVFLVNLFLLQGYFDVQAGGPGMSHVALMPKEWRVALGEATKNMGVQVPGDRFAQVDVAGGEAEEGLI